MVTVQDPGNYLKGSFVKESKITELEILSEADYKEGNYGKKLEMKVRCNDTEKTEKTLTCNNTNHTKLMSLFGNETKGWVGKKIRVLTALQNTPNGMKDVIHIDSAI